jgi:hypothetical protein
MSLFKQDPALALAKTEDKIGAIKANIEALQAERAENWRSKTLQRLSGSGRSLLGIESLSRPSSGGC